MGTETRRFKIWSVKHDEAGGKKIEKIFKTPITNPSWAIRNRQSFVISSFHTPFVDIPAHSGGVLIAVQQTHTRNSLRRLVNVHEKPRPTFRNGIGAKRVKLAFISAALATLVIATPTQPRDDELASACTTGSLQCCDSVVSADSAAASVLLGLLSIVVQDLNVDVGLTCSPITAASSCSSPRHAVCCQDNIVHCKRLFADLYHEQGASSPLTVSLFTITSEKTIVISGGLQTSSTAAHLAIHALPMINQPVPEKSSSAPNDNTNTPLLLRRRQAPTTIWVHCLPCPRKLTIYPQLEILNLCSSSPEPVSPIPKRPTLLTKLGIDGRHWHPHSPFDDSHILENSLRRPPIHRQHDFSVVCSTYTTNPPPTFRIHGIRASHDSTGTASPNLSVKRSHLISPEVTSAKNSVERMKMGIMGSWAPAYSFGSYPNVGIVKLAFISAALATLVVATPTPRDDELASVCTTGSLQCCNSVVSPDSLSNTVSGLLGLLGIVVGDLKLLVGLTCSPITAGSSCSAPRQAVCCQDNNFSLISINCVPPPP
ncbi:hypothetical protein D9757_008592 [Collybiopsis confluens]|uniref:Hydrophobin n=1 Tax=Collybiopsis confluens TaxID=2823264 RepID=A0A8H5HNC7_9AGAR|nr:hypothetical protein D9757_008592 [Collybiopsis confluens]